MKKLIKFSKESRDAFYKQLKKLSDNLFKEIDEKNESGETILHRAVEMSNQKIVRLLVERGADLNAKNNRGETALHLAALVRSRENVKVLIESGADINATSNNKSVPLHLACLTGGKGAVEELVKAGADVNARDRYGNSPLYYAQRHTKIVSFLEKNAAEIKNTPEICDEVVESVGEMVDVWSRKFLPKLKGKVVSLEEIRKRDKSLIIEDFNKVISRVVGKMNTMIKELDER
ncbi:ankyrin repeat domain-containing protein [Wolbachia endosymbiont (group A) of Lypha dubia]|uniref:ankyrin repeat domain-containing protein n=1 Tax=Wolbachia endosymbiont (group A) of Lypha dubia TaxID=3066146 RepID=UPI0033428E7E